MRRSLRSLATGWVKWLSAIAFQAACAFQACLRVTTFNLLVPFRRACGVRFSCSLVQMYMRTFLMTDLGLIETANRFIQNSTVV
jgi:hypothetical protein